MAQAPQLNDSQLNLLAKIAANTGETQPKHGDGQHNLLFKIAQNTYASAVNGSNIDISDVSGLQSALDGKASTTHASTHATGGSDALTPNDIGAVAKAGDTMTGKLNLPASTTASAGINLGVGAIPTSPVVGDLIATNSRLYFQETPTQQRIIAYTNSSNNFNNVQTIDANTTTTLLRVTQRGTGEALRVEDETTPDATAFVVSNTGRVGVGVTPDATVALSVDTTGIKFNDNSIQLTAALGLSASSYIIARPGDNLATKYGEAKVLTPQGNARSATNRASLIILPGTYSLAAELAIDAEFVDIVGLGAQFQSPAVIVTNNTLNVTANDVRVSGISVGTQAFKIGNNKPLQVFENCVGGDSSFAVDEEASGTFLGCVAGDTSFGGGGAGTASGKFTNCISGSVSFGSQVLASGYFYNCVAGQDSFGYDGTLSGELISCRLIGVGAAYETPSGSGIIRFCLDGDNNIVNADAP